MSDQLLRDHVTEYIQHDGKVVPRMWPLFEWFGLFTILLFLLFL